MAVNPKNLGGKVVTRVTSFLDLASRAWGAEWQAPDHGAYEFNNGSRRYDSTDKGLTGVYGVDAPEVILLDGTQYPDMRDGLFDGGGVDQLGQANFGHGYYNEIARDGGDPGISPLGLPYQATQGTSTPIVQGACDKYYINTVLLLNGIGAAGSTGIIDSSPSAHVMTSVGTVLDGANGIVFTGSSTLQCPNSADFALQKSNGWTIEFWVKTTVNSFQSPIASSNSGSKGWAVRIAGNPNLAVQFQINGGGTGSLSGSTGAINIADGQYHHVAIDVSPIALTCRIWLDGNELSSQAYISNDPVFDNSIAFWQKDWISEGFTGSIKGLRITQHVARYYTTNAAPSAGVFVPPPVPYPALQCVPASSPSWSTSLMPALTMGATKLCIAYGAGTGAVGIFVMGGRRDLPTSNPLSPVNYSLDLGQSWTAIPNTAIDFTNGAIQSIAYGNGIFVAVTQSALYHGTSTDGIIWTARSHTSQSYAYISYSIGKFFIGPSGSSSAVATSVDGITFTAYTMPAAAAWSLTATDGSIIVWMTATSTTTARSVDFGATFTLGGNTPIGYAVADVAYGNHLFCASLVDVSGQVATSISMDGGVTWSTACPNVTLASSGGTRLIFANGVFYLFGLATVFTSTDGLTWTAMSALMPASQSWGMATDWAGNFIGAGITNNATLVGIGKLS